MAHIVDRWMTKTRHRTDRYGKGLRWQVEWIEAGRKRRRSFEHKALAEDFLTEIRHQQKRGTYRAPTRTWTVAEIFKAWEDSHPTRPPNTVSANASALKMFKDIAHLDASTITRREIQNATNALMARYAPNTIRGAYGALGSAFNWAHAEDLIPTNPCKGIRLPAKPSKIIDPITTEDIHTIAEAMNPTLRAMAFLGAATGMRSGEIRGATWQAIKDGQLSIHHQLDLPGFTFAPLKTPSSKRRITLGPQTLAMLNRLREQIGTGNNGLVFHHNGKGFAAQSLIQAWIRARKKTGLDISGWHQLRHYHASMLIAAGFSPVAVARRLGHSNASQVLEIYAHLWPSDDAGMAVAGDSALP